MNVRHRQDVVWMRTTPTPETGAVHAEGPAPLGGFAEGERQG